MMDDDGNDDQSEQQIIFRQKQICMWGVFENFAYVQMRLMGQNMGKENPVKTMFCLITQEEMKGEKARRQRDRLCKKNPA